MGANLGFAAAYNRGIRAVPEEYVILLNADTEVTQPGWVEALMAVAEGGSRIAAVACKMVFARNPRRLNSVGGLVYWWSGSVDAGFGEIDRGQYDADFVPFSCSGGAMLVRRETYLAIGGLDAATFVYLEDVDLCWRLRLRGYEIAFAPNAVVKHEFSVTLGPISPRKIYFTHRNFLRVMLRNYSLATLVWALPAYAMWTGVKVAGGLLLERSIAVALAPILAVSWNVVMLRDTLRTRREIQSTRHVSDKEIRCAMSDRGFEPLRSLQRRRAMAHGQLEGHGV